MRETKNDENTPINTTKSKPTNENKANTPSDHTETIVVVRSACFLRSLIFCLACVSVLCSFVILRVRVLYCCLFVCYGFRSWILFFVWWPHFHFRKGLHFLELSLCISSIVPFVVWFLWYWSVSVFCFHLLFPNVCDCASIVTTGFAVSVCFVFVCAFLLKFRVCLCVCSVPDSCLDGFPCFFWFNIVLCLLLYQTFDLGLAVFSVALLSHVFGSYCWLQFCASAAQAA